MKSDRFQIALREYFSDKKDHPLYDFWIKDHLLKVGIPTRELHSYLHNIMQYIKKQYDIAGNKILDLGCGMGEFSVFLALQGYDVVGVDMDEKQLKIARTLSEENGNVAEFIRADATKLPFRDEEFDLVICFDVFEHIEDLLPVLRELYRVTKKNSAIFVRFPNKLRLIDDHTRLPLLPLLPKKMWGLYLSIFGKNRKYYQEGLGVYYRTFQQVLKIAMISGFFVEVIPLDLAYPYLPENIKKIINKFPKLIPSIEPHFHIVLIKKRGEKTVEPSTLSTLIENIFWPIMLLTFGLILLAVLRLIAKVKKTKRNKKF